MFTKIPLCPRRTARNALKKLFWGSDWPKGKHYSRDPLRVGWDASKVSGALPRLPTFPPSCTACPPGAVAIRFSAVIHRTRTKIPPLRTRVRTADDLIEDCRRFTTRDPAQLREDRPDHPTATLYIRAPSISSCSLRGRLRPSIPASERVTSHKPTACSSHLVFVPVPVFAPLCGSKFQNLSVRITRHANNPQNQRIRGHCGQTCYLCELFPLTIACVPSLRTFQAPPLGSQVRTI